MIISPIFEIQTVASGSSSNKYKALIFTSRHAISAWAKTNDLSGVFGYVVGSRTAAFAGKFGMKVVSANGTAADLVRLIVDENPTGPLLHIRGEHTHGDIVGGLKNAGIETDSLIVYRQVEQSLSQGALDAIDSDIPVVLPVFSPRSAALLSGALLNVPNRENITVVAMSSSVAAAWDSRVEAVIRIAAGPSVDEMLSETKRVIQDLS